MGVEPLPSAKALIYYAMWHLSGCVLNGLLTALSDIPYNRERI